MPKFTISNSLMAVDPFCFLPLLVLQIDRGASPLVSSMALLRHPTLQPFQKPAPTEMGRTQSRDSVA